MTADAPILAVASQDCELAQKNKTDEGPFLCPSVLLVAIRSRPEQWTAAARSYQAIWIWLSPCWLFR